MVTRQPPSPAEQELWNAVVTGVRAADDADEAGLAAAVGRLARLPQPWARRVLADTWALLVNDLSLDRPSGGEARRTIDPSGREGRAPADDLPLPGGTGCRATGRRPPSAGTPERLRRSLLLIQRLAAGLGEEGVGAFLDVALAGNRRRAPARYQPVLDPGVAE